MSIDWLLARMSEQGGAPAIIWEDEPTSYTQILDRISTWRSRLDEYQVQPGRVVTVRGDYSPNAVALLLALIERSAIIVPLTDAAEPQYDRFLDIAEVELVLRLDEQDAVEAIRTGRRSQHRLYQELRKAGDPGLILFSSGSTGESKAALHNFANLLKKFEVKRHKMRTISFLLLDHIGGINTLLYTLSNGGAVVSIRDRSPDKVCRAIERHAVELLPTSPTFLNLLLISEAYQRYDLSSLKLVTYGTEVMPESTLTRLHAVLPEARLLQTYGLSEVGILRSKSKSSDSLWVKVGGEGFETKVVDGVLWIKAHSAMLGYLNAPDPFDSEGWLNTGDSVEVDGEYIRFMGRDSEIINVGGEKVYPAEVESVLLQMDNVKDVVVRGEKHPLTGHIVTAQVNLNEPEDRRAFQRRMRTFCKERLASFKIPAKVQIADHVQFSARYKRIRRPDAVESQ